MSLQSCAEVVAADAQCSNTFYYPVGAFGRRAASNCRCVMAGKTCQINSSPGYEIYLIQAGSATTTRVCKIKYHPNTHGFLSAPFPKLLRAGTGLLARPFNWPLTKLKGRLKGPPRGALLGRPSKRSRDLGRPQRLSCAQFGSRYPMSGTLNKSASDSH